MTVSNTSEVIVRPWIELAAIKQLHATRHTRMSFLVFIIALDALYIFLK